jgi:hypothetical protein
MSDLVASLPSGFGLSPVNEHHTRREGAPHHRQDEEHAHEDGPRDEGSDHNRPRQDSPPPPVDDPGVPAETLFAATMLANQLSQQPPSPGEYRLRNGQAWSPPDSPLRLKDKLI